MRFLKYFFCLLLIAGSSSVFSQTATLRGFVYDKENGEPVIFTNVVLKGTSYGVGTDVNGYYQLSKIKPGNYTIMVSYIGYDTLKIPIALKENDIISKKLYLTKKTVALGEVNVSAEKQEQKTDVRISVQKVTTKEIKQVAAVGGEADIAQYLQILPGVVSSGDQGGQLYIRGGSPVQNLVLLDGMTLYNPFHSIGLFSVFDADIMRNAEVYTGGFNAEYGGRVSSVMDIKTRDGNKKRFAGKVSSSPFMSKLILEGPLVKQESDDKGSTSFILSGKTSYLQQSSKIFYNYVGKDGIPYNFTDLYGKISINGANGSKINFFGFQFSDSVNYPKVSRLGWVSRGFGSSFVIVPGNSPVLIDGVFAYSNYNISMSEEGAKPRTSGINGFNMGLNFTYFILNDEFKYGINVQAFGTDYSIYTPLNSEVNTPGFSTEVIGYARYKMVLHKLILDPGIHLHYYAKLSEPSFEPRFGAKYNVTDRFRLKLAAGYYSQNLISANSDKDVVNLFYGFLTSPENLPDKFNGNDITSKLQKSRHLIAGFEFDLAKNLDLNVEGYIKDFYQLTNVNREKLFDLDPDFVIEQGQAKGIDFLVKYDYKRMYFWATYSLGFVNRQAESNGQLVEYQPLFDRRHNVSLVSAYTFGKGLNWELDGRWSLGSGFPFTQTAGYYQKMPFDQGINTNLNTSNADLGIIYGDFNKGRLPYYHRLDFSLKRRFEVGKNSTLEAVASVTNLYDRQNIFYLNRVTGEKIYQLPILPSLGASLTF